MTTEESSIYFTVDNQFLSPMTVDWGDGSSEVVSKTNAFRHDFQTSGLKTIRVEGKDFINFWHEGSENPLKSLDVSKAPTLKSLRCNQNNLVSLDLKNNRALTRLECYDNKLESLDLSNNRALEWLECGWNELTSLVVSNKPVLRHLDCQDQDNSLTSLVISATPALQNVHCEANRLDADTLNDLFEMLPSRNGRDAGRIYCWNDPGYNDNFDDGEEITAADIAIAEAKNWVVWQ